MAIEYPSLPPRIETHGAAWSIMPYESPATVRTAVRVGRQRGGARVPGPLGTGRWEADRAGHRFQSVQLRLVRKAWICVHDLRIGCHFATVDQLAILDVTFQLVPPDHLQRVLHAKPEGFFMVSSAGRGSTLSYMGGLNPGFDYPETSYNETRAILITYGALWQNRHLGICPTVLHEIGHVMTHGGNGLSYATFDEARATQLRGTRVSRNPGAMEALCNTYMYFLCYSSGDPAVRAYGTGTDVQRDLRTRNALRGSLAFRRLPEAWQRRFEER
jgi:hypothetical protein